MSGPASGDGDRSTLERAEELVDRATRDVARFSIKALARAREEAEDIWAEADAVRRGHAPSGPDPPDRR